jgi:N6-adenosine-specific RNA methylase IME4
MLLTQAHRAIAEARGLDDIKDIRDKAEAVRKYAQSAGMGLDIQNHAAEVKLRAERKAGELLTQLQLHGGDRKSQKAEDRPKLEDIGITKDQSSRWQLTAAVPEREFEKYVTQTKLDRGEVTTAGLLRVAREVIAKKRKKNKQKSSEENAEARESLATVGSLSDLVAEGQKFSCLYADPFTRAAADNQSAKMLDELAALPVSSLLLENAHLHLWVTTDSLFDAKSVMEAWGFTYKSCFVWLKPQTGLGDYWRESHEILLLGVRGSLAFLDNSVSSWLRANRSSQGSKPESIRKLLERISPGPYLELFGRKPTPGWTVVGDQPAPNQPGAA